MPLDPVNYIVKENATVFPRLDQSLTQWETFSEIDSLWSDYHSYNGTWSLIMDSFHLEHWTNHQNYPLLESTLGLTTSFDLIGTGDEAMWKDSFFRGLGLKKGHYKESKVLFLYAVPDIPRHEATKQGSVDGEVISESPEE